MARGLRALLKMPTRKFVRDLLSAGTFTVFLPRGFYELKIGGGGGGGGYYGSTTTKNDNYATGKYSFAGGGAGGTGWYYIEVPESANATCIVGAGGKKSNKSTTKAGTGGISRFTCGDISVTMNGGQGGKAASAAVGTGGAGGTQGSVVGVYRTKGGGAGGAGSRCYWTRIDTGSSGSSDAYGGYPAIYHSGGSTGDTPYFCYDGYTVDNEAGDGYEGFIYLRYLGMKAPQE